MYYSWMVLFFLVIYQVLFALSSRHSVDINVKSKTETEEHSDSLRDYAGVGVHKFPWMPSRIHRGNKQADVSSFISSKGFGDWTLGGLVSLGNKYWRGLNKWASRIGSDSLDGQPPVAGYNLTSDDILDILYVGDGDLPPAGKEEIGDMTTEGKEATDEGIGDSTTEGKVVTDERVGETTEGKVVKAVNEGGIGEWTLGGKPVQQKEKESKEIMDVVAGLFNAKKN